VWSNSRLCCERITLEGGAKRPLQVMAKHRRAGLVPVIAELAGNAEQIVKILSADAGRAIAELRLTIGDAAFVLHRVAANRLWR
jgi:hypothetical protein